MKYTAEKAEKSQFKVVLTLDKTDWDNSISEAYQKTKGKYVVQGFRKGHVPFNVIVNQYGKETFYEDALNIAIQKYYPEVLKAEKDTIHAVGDPDIKLGNFSDDEIVLNISIPVMPDVKIGSYKGLKVEKVEYTVSEDDIEKDLNRLKERNSREVAVLDRPCNNGDIVVIDFSGSVDGVKFEGGTAEKYKLTLGSHSFVPGFEEQVVGMKIDEEKNINVKFPDDYVDELKGKDAVFAVKLHEIYVKEYSELTDEFIKDSTGEESLEAYKNKVRENMKKDNDRRSRDENEDRLLEEIAKTTEVEIPDCMVESEITNMIQQLEYRLMYQGLKLADYLKVTGQKEEDLRKSYKDNALNRVKKQLIVNNIIDAEKITASKEEIDEKVKEQAASVSKSEEEYRKGMDERQFEYISNSIVIDKLFKFLTENNTFEVKPVEEKDSSDKENKKA